MSDSTVTTAIIGLDLGDRITHSCGLDAERQVVDRGRFATTSDALRKAFADRPPTRVVLEAGSQSSWISALLQDLGHEVQVADPRRIALIAKGHRKTDRRDAEVLARLALGMPELIGKVRHRDSKQQAALAVLRSRDLLVRMRTKAIQHVRGTCKGFGVRLRSCSTAAFHRAIREDVPECLKDALDPIFQHLEQVDQQIRKLDARLKVLADERYPESKPLRQVNGVGPLTSLAMVLTLAEPTRFKRSRDVGSWVGLAPRVSQSGDRNPQLSISKTGDGYLRRLLVQSAHYILGPFGQDSDLRRFGLRLIERGGKGARRRAAVAVARKLAILLHRLWVDGDPYEPLRNSDRSAAAASA